MTSKSFSVPVEPTVLIWARKSIGMSEEEVIKRIKGITVNTIKEWEKKGGQVNPTFAQVERLSAIYKRPLTAFLLPAPPKEAPFPKDFRTLPSDERKPLHPKTYLVIRKARRFQYSAMELIKELREPSKKVHLKANPSDNPETLAENMRTQLGIKDFPRSISFTKETVLDEWIKILETNGILVFQISITMNKEIRGFSLFDEEVPVIVLRRSDQTSAKIFTLFHELAHLLLREGGICDLEESDISHEKFCNHFAGAFLVPKNELLSHPVVQANLTMKEWSETLLNAIARNFKVSKEVILRRLLILGKTTKEYYLKKHKEWKNKYKEPKGGAPRRDEIKICVKERGRKYVSMVFDAYGRNRIDNLRVVDYLGVTSDKISKVKETI
ncbi:MAG: XRE family transcriptional regulator [Planctomycetota bacterium]|nr:XRE family transcriptional regulator [Planctomycetota bacterium]MDI6786777.1 XRE family transcriptional regulator [Planctomycetota bacterium]